MAKQMRVKCNCGHVLNAMPGNVCPKCHQPLAFPTEGMIHLYRKGSPYGIAGGFGIYLNGEAMGYIGNKETVNIPVNYGTYTLHVAVGMSRKCRDLVVEITSDNTVGYAKVYIKPGFWANQFVIEPSVREEMPLD